MRTTVRGGLHGTTHPRRDRSVRQGLVVGAAVPSNELYPGGGTTTVRAASAPGSLRCSRQGRHELGLKSPGRWRGRRRSPLGGRSRRADQVDGCGPFTQGRAQEDGPPAPSRSGAPGVLARGAVVPRVDADVDHPSRPGAIARAHAVAGATCHGPPGRLSTKLSRSWLSPRYGKWHVSGLHSPTRSTTTSRWWISSKHDRRCIRDVSVQRRGWRDPEWASVSGLSETCCWGLLFATP